MRRAEDILKDLAFSKEAPESTKTAFLKHLQQALRSGDKAEVIPSPFSQKSCELKKASAPHQLSFDSEIMSPSGHLQKKTRQA